MAVSLKRSSSNTSSDAQPKAKIPKTEDPDPCEGPSGENDNSDITSAVKRLISANQKPEDKTEKNLLGPSMQTLLAVFPWLDKFSRICFQSIGIKSIADLIPAMDSFKINATKSAEECALKPNRAAKLRRVMSHYILYFRFIYSSCKEPFSEILYCDVMSDLLARLIDMEFKASKKSKELPNNVASRILVTLYYCLDNDQDYVIDTLLKTKLMNKAFSELSSLLFSRVLRNSPGKHIFDLVYVRHILAFKMWKKSAKEPEERKHIIQLAKEKVVAPPKFREKVKTGYLNSVLPNIPKNVENITCFLLTAKFDVKAKSQAFLKTQSEARNNFFFDESFSTDLERVLLFEDPVDPGDEDKINGPIMNEIWGDLNPETNINDYLKFAQVSSVAKFDRMRIKRKKKALVAKRKAALKKKNKTAKEEPPAEKKLLDLIPIDTELKVKTEKNSLEKVEIEPEPIVEPKLETVPEPQVEPNLEEPVEEKVPEIPEVPHELQEKEQITQLIPVHTLENELYIVSESEIPEISVPSTSKEILIPELPLPEKVPESIIYENKIEDNLILEPIDEKQTDIKKHISREDNQKAINLSFSVDPIHESQGSQYRGRSLHYETAIRDHAIFTHQTTLRKLMYNNIPFPILDKSPLRNFPSLMTASTRCMCNQCVKNLRILVYNAKTLSRFMEVPEPDEHEEIVEPFAYSHETQPPLPPTSPPPPTPPPPPPPPPPEEPIIIEEHPNLPIKKRYSIASTSKDEPAYPAYPMMSIAALQTSGCEPLHIGYDMSNSPQSPPPQPIPSTSSERCKFKTPAQLKEVMYPPQKINGHPDVLIRLNEYENLCPYDFNSQNPKEKKERKRSRSSKGTSRKKKY